METTVKATRKLGIEKGYLQDKKMVLKPVIRTNPMIGDKKEHVLYFMQDGASRWFILPKNEYNELYNIFKSDEEAEFFSDLLGQEVHPRKGSDLFWSRLTIKITKNVKFMQDGKTFDMSDPMDNLRVRILRLSDEITEGWEQRYDKPKSKFCLVDEDYEETNSSKEMDIMEAIWTFWGEIKSSPKKMKDFLSVYFMTKRINKMVPEDFSKEQLSAEINKLIKEDSATVYAIINDPDADMKLFLTRAVRCGAIERKGVTGFVIPGDGVEYTAKDMVAHLNVLKQATDTTYIKIDTQIKQAKFI
jgi:hypothetical protein